jgi:putative DNA primase/helicase
MAFAPAPEWLLRLVENKPDRAAADRPKHAAAVRPGARLVTAYGEKILREECEKISTAPDGTVNDTLNRCSFNVGTLVGAGEIAEHIARAALIEAGMVVVKPPWTAVDITKHVDRALREGNEHPRQKPEPNGGDARRGEPDGGDHLPPEFSAEALALLFAERHARDLRYVAKWGHWIHLDGARWREEGTLLVFDRARAICREAAAGAGPRIASILTNGNTSATVERLARADRRLAATVDQWDRDPWLLNTPEGVIDLRTGQSRPHDSLDYITKVCAVSPEGDCPSWLSFLDRVTAGDRDLQGFIQRMLGYSLTGDASAHALFFLYGTGANGKSVLIDTVSGIVGDYHKTAPIETFTATNGERHPTDLAMLRGARLVTAVETEEGRRWAESKIKALTGGDKISARFMRQDFFEFTPQFKLIIAGNHRPGLRSVDEAIRRRFHLVPFSVTIPAEERDPRLREKLKAEWPGILRWMIEGCLDWQCQGLAPPPAVAGATEAYLEAEDAFSAWIDERCKRDPVSWSGTTELFGSWKAWAERAGEFPGSAKRFAQNLEARGFRPSRQMRGRGFLGLTLVQVDDTPLPWDDR